MHPVASFPFVPFALCTPLFIALTESPVDRAVAFLYSFSPPTPIVVKPYYLPKHLLLPKMNMKKHPLRSAK
jgi:hypothetical protein